MAANISPKEFYSLILEDDPSRAHQVLSNIPLDSPQPYVSFRNAEGEEHLHGQTALHAAARAGHDQLIQLLLESNSDIEARKANGGTPIAVASWGGHDKVVDQLLAAGADKNAPTNEGATPIYISSQEGHDKLVERFLAAGANKNAATNDGRTPIYIASENGHHPVVELLLAAGADKDAARKDGVTPIFIASQNRHEKVVELLLAAGADKNAARKDGVTPIFIASQLGHDKVVELLLAAGADKNAMKDGKWTPLHIAKHQSHTRIVELLTSPLPPSTIDAYHSRQAELNSQLDERRSAFLRSNHEAPFRTILDRFQISSSSRNLLFLTHGLELSTLEHLTIEVLKDVLKDNIPQLPTLRITALFKELQKVTLPAAPHPPLSALPVDFPHLDNLLIPLDNLKIESTAFAEGADGKVYHAEYHGLSVAVKKLINPDVNSGIPTSYS